MKIGLKGAHSCAAALATVTALLVSAAPAFATNRNDCSSGADSGRKVLSAVALTADGRLLCFNERRPERAREIGYVEGLTGGDNTLVGIDFRVQNGALYGVGNAGGIYVLDTDNATALRVGALTEPLQGTHFGVDFNPAADRLRIVSDTGQNLRHNVNAGGVTIADGALSYTTGASATGITGAAYTNNDLDAATATTLFDLDGALDQIALQSPPNNGSLAATGKLDVDTASPAGFDIYSSLAPGVAFANRALAVLNVNGESCLYTVSLLTGAARYAGSFRTDVVDLAIPLNQ